MSAGVELSDQDLWRSVLVGDGSAFTTLYDKHAARIHRFLVRRVGYQDAEDLTANVFLEAWRQRGRIQLDDSAGLVPWLFGAALNLSRAHGRREQRGNRLLHRLGGLSDEPDPATAVTDRVDSEQRARRARQAMATLSGEDQDVLALCLMEDLTPTQAAQVLGRPPSTVRSRLTRARRRLSAAYTALDDDSNR